MTNDTDFSLEPFAPPPRRATGLGLRIVTALAKQLGADIRRPSQVEGNEFVVSVPSE